MNCGHLFNGIGGFALAAHWMGWNNVMHCEIDPFCNKVMNHHFPNSHQHEDIRTTDFTIWRGKLDLLTGGFPCQPYSNAGKRKGKEDDRHLWPEMLRAIREIQPSGIVGENVRGLTNWNGGLVFDEVQADLEAEGYEVLPFLLPAAGVEAPHERYRIWFIAHANRLPSSVSVQQWRQKATSDTHIGWEIKRRSNSDAYFDKRCEGGLHKTQSKEAERYTGARDARYVRGDWKDFPTQSPVCNRNDGLPGGLADISFSKWRNESLKALGNAIVPQVALQIFKAIEQMTIQNK